MLHSNTDPVCGPSIVHSNRDPVGGPSIVHSNRDPVCGPSIVHSHMDPVCGPFGLDSWPASLSFSHTPLSPTPTYTRVHACTHRLKTHSGLETFQPVVLSFRTPMAP